LLIAALLHYALTRIAALTPRNYGLPPKEHRVILGENISTHSPHTRACQRTDSEMRRRYLRCAISIPVTILRQSMPEVHGYGMNISEGGLAVNTFVPLLAGENVQINWTLPDHKGPFLAESRICG
jgi:hypothetical protein